MNLQITDANPPPIAQMRAEFEKVIQTTPKLKDNTPLGIAELNGEFLHYMNPDTDTLWIGFAIGRRFSVKNAAALAQRGVESNWVQAPDCAMSRIEVLTPESLDKIAFTKRMFAESGKMLNMLRHIEANPDLTGDPFYLKQISELIKRVESTSRPSPVTPP